MNGLVLEGGAMRGLFTAGVLDVLMENGITFDGVVGVSAGAVFGCNFKSHQIGRVIRYNKRFARDPRYSGLRSLITTGDLYNERFCYHDVPENLDPFDTKAFRADPTEFLVVATDINTGRSVYAVCAHGDAKDIEWMRASASMPIVSRPVTIGSKQLLDGGITDSIPIRFMQRRGYDRCVVVLTQPETYRKKKNAALPLLRVSMRKYPALIDAMEKRHIRYNESLEYIHSAEEKGELFVIRPDEALKIGKTEHDPSVMESVYQIGRETALRELTNMKAFLEEKEQ